MSKIINSLLKIAETLLEQEKVDKNLIKRELSTLSSKLDIWGFDKQSQKIDSILKKAAIPASNEREFMSLVFDQIQKLPAQIGVTNSDLDFELQKRLSKMARDLVQKQQIFTGADIPLETLWADIYQNTQETLTKLQPEIQIVNDNYYELTQHFGDFAEIDSVDKWIQTLAEKNMLLEETPGPDQEGLPPGVVKIREMVLPQLNKKIEKLIKIANKLGLAAPTIKILSEEIIMNPKTKLGEKWLTVQISGQAPNINGWEFVAKIEHHDEANIVSSPNKQAMPIEYHTIDANCEHCGHDRRRNNTYILKNQENGELKQVGSTCLRDFTGHPNPEVIANYFERLSQLDPGVIIELNEANTGPIDPTSRNSKYYIDPLEYLANVAAVIRNFGWVSKTQAYESMDSITPTAPLALDNMFPTQYTKPIAVTSEDYTLAQEALDWIHSQDEEFYAQNNYLHNLWAASQLSAIGYSHIGLMASLINAYKKESEAQKKKSVVQLPSNYVGAVGDRQEFILTVDNVKQFPSQYQYNSFVYLNNMRDNQGNIIIWWGSKELDEGATYSMTATIKEHKEYNGVPQTVISNPRKIQQI